MKLRLHELAYIGPASNYSKLLAISERMILQLTRLIWIRV